MNRVGTLILLVVSVLLGAASNLHAATATWNANPEPDVTGYKLSYGTTSGVYTATIDVGNVTSYAVSGLTPATRYYFVVQAYNAGGLTSPNSAEVIFDSPATTRATIAVLTPALGPAGTSVTITGTNFGATRGTTTVTFNGTSATPTSWSATSIVVPVPAGATTGNVVVTVGGLTSNGVSFTVPVPPTVTTLSPTSGPVATPVTITGANFGATLGASTVTFNGTIATPTNWSATSIVVPVPAGATTGNVVVTVGGTASNGLAFTVVPASLTGNPGNVHRKQKLTATWSGIESPTTTDWIALVSQGAADAEYVTYEYTTGTSSGSRDLTVPASVAAGPYELRLFAQNSWRRLVVSDPIQVEIEPTTLAVSPATVAPGGSLTVTWQNIDVPSVTDWLSIVPVGAPDASYRTFVYATGRESDSTLFAVPEGLNAGAYEVRLFANNSWQRLASSGVTVTAPGPSLVASPVATAPGGTLTVRWRNIAGPTASDWIGLYVTGAADASYVTRWGTSGSASDRSLFPLPVDLAPGSYELRLFSNDTLTRVTTSNGFEVTVGPSLTGSPATVAPGGTLAAHWTGIADPAATDWIALVSLNAADARFLAWRYTTGEATGSLGLTIPGALPPGTYELRLFAHNSWQRLAVSNLVEVGPTLVMSPTNVAPGGTVTIAWAGSSTASPTDWLAIVPRSAPDTRYVAWVYANERSADSMLFVLPPTLPAGTYDVRLFAHNSWQRIAVSNVFTVTAANPSLAATPVAGVAGGTVTAEWKGIAAPTSSDWIGVFLVGADDTSYLARAFTNGGAAGSTSIILPGVVATGSYELRLIAGNTFVRLAASNGFSVVVGPVVQVTSSSSAATGIVAVAWKGIASPTPTDWIALVPLNAPDTNFVAWSYTSGVASGSLQLPVPAAAAAGSYQVRLFAQNSWQRLAVSDVVVTIVR